MKRFVCFLLTALLLVSLCSVTPAEDSSSSAEETTTRTFRQTGVSFEMPASLSNLQGVLEISPYAGAISYHPALYAMDITYIAMSGEEYTALEQKYETEEITEEEMNDLLLHIISIGTIVSTFGTPEDVPALASFSDIQLLGSADGFNFYYINFFDPASAAVLEDVYVEEAAKIAESMPEVFKNATFSMPADPALDIIGAQISFTGKDLDGNEYTSEELFAANKFTMINIWGSWCPPCVSEMGYLAGLHETVQELGCGLVGIEFEYSYDDDTLKTARDLLEENGTGYPNILVNEDMAFMNSIQSFPTSLFVDQTGTVLLPPFMGVPGDENYLYLPALEKLLAEAETADTAGEEEAKDSEKAEDNTPSDAPSESTAVPNEENTYRVIILDEAGPVENVAVQFCSDNLCEVGITDAEGIAVFEQPEGLVYTIHVLTVPDGYVEDPQEYASLDVFSDTTILLKKK